MRPNKTPWVDRTVDRFEKALKSVAPDDEWLPLPDPEGSGVKELGCGHYGCVMPTDSGDVVFKLTTDPAEAAFVRAALHLAARDPWPAGMIEYKAIYQLAGTRHRNRTVFALWRQEAYEVGTVLDLFRGIDPYDKRMRLEGSNLLMNARVGAAAFRDYFSRRGQLDKILSHEGVAWDVVGENFELLMQPAYGSVALRPKFVGGLPQGLLYGAAPSITQLLKRYRGAQKAAVGLRVYDACIEMMEHNSPLMTNVGSAMGYYRDREIVLADVHENNIGYAGHSEYDDRIVVITDPGHAVFLDDRYDDLDVEELHA